MTDSFISKDTTLRESFLATDSNPRWAVSEEISHCVMAPRAVENIEFMAPVTVENIEFMAPRTVEHIKFMEPRIVENINSSLCGHCKL